MNFKGLPRFACNAAIGAFVGTIFASLIARSILFFCFGFLVTFDLTLSPEYMGHLVHLVAGFSGSYWTVTCIGWAINCDIVKVMLNLRL